MPTHPADLGEHPFAVFMAAESHVSRAERVWLRWCAAVEKLLGHSLDGDEALEGYSLDGAYDAWLAGDLPGDYFTDVQHAKAALAAKARA